MSFTERLKVQIESVFDSTGFQQFRASMAKANAVTEKFGAKVADAFDMGQQLRGARRKVAKVSEALEGVIENTDISFAAEELPAPFQDEDGRMMAADDPRMAEAMANQLERMDDATKNIPSKPFADAEGDQIPAVMGGAPDETQGFPPGLQTERMRRELQRLPQAVPDIFRGRGELDSPFRMMQQGFDPSKFQMPNLERFSGASMQRALLSMGMMTAQTKAMSASIRGANRGSGTFLTRLKNMTGGLRSAAPAARNLQMKLLGLQFTMLTLAFIFGGLMMGALGAVGVFEVLGNTLKFLFLPTALNVLDGMLDIQEAIMGMDRETRRAIGDFFFMVTVFSVAVGLLAALGKAFVAAGSALITLGGYIKLLGGLIAPFLGSWTAAFSSLTGFIMTAQAIILKFTGVVVSGFAAAAGFILGLVGAFMVVVKAAEKFGEIAGIIAAVLMGIVGAIAIVAGAIASIPVLIAAGIGIIVGAILGLLYVFREQLLAGIMAVFKAIVGGIMFLINAFMGLINFIVNDVVGGFVRMGEDIYNFLFGNSIFPDMIDGIIGLFKDLVKFIAGLPLKIAKIALKLGKGFVNAIIKGINAVGGKIWEALKSFLPGKVVDALEAAGGFVEGGVDVVTDLGEAAFDSASNLVSSGSEIYSDVFGNGSSNGGTTKNVKNEEVNVNADVQANGTEETDQETGEALGQGVADGYKNRKGNTRNGLG